MFKQVYPNPVGRAEVFSSILRASTNLEVDGIERTLSKKREDDCLFSFAEAFMYRLPDRHIGWHYKSSAPPSRRLLLHQGVPTRVRMGRQELPNSVRREVPVGKQNEIMRQAVSF